MTLFIPLSSPAPYVAKRTDHAMPISMKSMENAARRAAKLAGS